MLEKLHVLDYEINIKTINNENYVSLTDMIKAKNGDFFKKRRCKGVTRPLILIEGGEKIW